VDGRTASRLETWAPLASGLLLALPVLVFRYPPMGDLPFHEAGVALLRHFGDPRYLPPGLYARNLGEPNQLFHLAAYLVSLTCPTDWACKLVVAATLVAIATGAARLCDHLDVTRWGAVVVAPVSLGWMARWGLVGNLVGLAALLWTLPILDRAARHPTPMRCLGSIGAAVLLFLAHESAMLLYGVAGLIFTLRTPRTPQAIALALGPVAATALLAAAYAVRSEGLKAPSILAARAVSVPLLERLSGLPATLFSVGRGSVGMLAGAVVAVVTLALVGARHEPDPRGPLARDRLSNAPYLALGLVCLAAYFVVPEALFGSTLLHGRFLAPAFALLVLASLPRSRTPFRAAALVVALPVAMVALTWHLFVTADRTYRDLDRVLAQMDDGVAVAALDLTPREPSVVAPVVGAGARVLAVHGGRLLFSFTDAPTYPVTMPPERRWNEPVARMVETPFAFAPTYDFTRFRYLLAWSPAARIRAVLPRALAPEGRLVTEEGSWMLFESTLALDSVVAPEAAPPPAAVEALATRVRALLALTQAR